MSVVWSNYLTLNKCPICHNPIDEDDAWLNCDGWAEHQACHDADTPSTSHDTEAGP